MLILCEYRRMNIIYYNNCYPPLPVIMFYAKEDITILLALKQTMMIVILLLVCYTKICTDCFFLAISLLFDILYKLHFDNFLLNKDDNDDNDAQCTCDLKGFFSSTAELCIADAAGRNMIKIHGLFLNARLILKHNVICQDL